MKTHYSVASLLALVMTIGGTQAELITVTGAMVNSGGTASEGSSSVVSAFADNAASTGTVVYTISGLDLDSIGGTNDSVTVTLSIGGFDNASSGANQSLRTNGGRISYGTNNSRVLDIGDRIDFSDISVTDVSLNGSSSAEWTSSSTAAYTGFNLGGVQGNLTEVDIDGTSFDNSASAPNYVSFYCDIGESSSALIELTGADTAEDQGRFRVDVLDFQVNVMGAPPAEVPPTWVEDPVEGEIADEGSTYSSTLVGKAIDANGDAITYAKVSGPAWLTVGGNGDLSGAPTSGDLGENNFTVSATDNDGSTNATLNILVREQLPPTWLEDPIQGKNAREDVAYSSTLAGKANDVNGDAITYAKVSGPAWLTVAGNGELSGTPTSGDLGDNSFTVSATDDDGSANATLNILVREAFSGDLSQPNVLFILADDLGVGDLGVTAQAARKVAGDPYLETPNLDSIANEGIIFSHMYSAPSCKPSRAMLQTGFQQGHGRLDQNSNNSLEYLRADPHDKTHGTILQEGGYRTGMFGKWHLNDSTDDTVGTAVDGRPNNKGYDDVLVSFDNQFHSTTMVVDDGAGDLVLLPAPSDPISSGGLLSVDLVTDHVINFIDESEAAGEPWYAMANYYVVHKNLSAIDRPYPAWAQSQSGYADWPGAEKNYARGVQLLDDAVGDLLDHLEASGLAENTIIIFASDNGNQTREGHSPGFFDSNWMFQGNKFTTWEGGVRTPFLVRWSGNPNLVPGSVNDTHVGSFADWLPTCAEMVGVDAPVGIDGESMWPLIRGEGASRRAPFFVCKNGSSYGLRMGDWKIRGSSLYNVRTNPGENSNQAGTRSDIFDALKALEPIAGSNRDGGGNSYFVQYKDWIVDETNLNSAASWSGGTPTRYINGSGGAADNWNTGPADNWVASLVNTAAADKLAVFADANTEMLGLQIAGSTHTMTAHALPGSDVFITNGMRLIANGRVVLDNATLKTLRDVDIRQGAVLAGGGTITGRQDIITGIAEFEGMLEPTVINRGRLEIGRPDDVPVFGQVLGDATGDPIDSASILQVDGRFEQNGQGVMAVDLGGTNVGDVLTAEFDQLVVNGDLHLGGSLEVRLVGGFTPTPGDLFEIASGETVTGSFDVTDDVVMTSDNAAAFRVHTSGTDVVLEALVGGVTVDGTPNWWLAEHGLATDTLDDDGDTVETDKEYVANTSPVDPDDVFKVTGLVAPDSSGSISWVVKPDRIYHIERSYSLTGGSWETIISDIVRETEEEVSIPLPEETQSAAFYRISVELP